MSINPETEYAGKISPSDSDYPYGSARNITVPGDGKGTPWLASLVNDIFGFQQALLKQAGIVPSGDADTSLVSQYLQSVIDVALAGGFFTGAGTANALLFSLIGDRKAPAAYTDGMQVSAKVAITNTGAATVDVAGLGAKDIVGTSIGGELEAGGFAVLMYRSATDDFEVLISKGSILSFDLITVKRFGAKGDGVVDDTAAFVAAVAFGVPINVPYTDDFYDLSAFTDAQLELLYGPGIVKVNSVIVDISAVAVFPDNDRSAFSVIKKDLQPVQHSGVEGSVGKGVAYHNSVRTGGYGQFGNVLSDYLVTAEIPSGQFDVGLTSWVTATDMAGGQIFGGWDGANTPAKVLGETFAGGVVGQEINVGNRWQDEGLQSDIGGARYTVGQQLVPDVLPTSDVSSESVVISVASPAVVTQVTHGYPADTPVVFKGDGTIPTGLVKGSVYYVSAAGLTADNYQVSATIGGASINTTGSFAAPINVIPSFPSNFAIAMGASVHGHKWWVGTLIRYDTLMDGGVAYLIKGGVGASVNVPLAYTQVVGNWVNGLDFSGGAFSNACLKFSSGQVSGSASAGGGQTTPATVKGYIVIDVAGSLQRVPYYDV